MATGGKILIRIVKDMTGETCLVGVPVRLQINASGYSIDITQYSDDNGEALFQVEPPAPCPYLVTATHNGVSKTHTGVISSTTDSNYTFVFPDPE